MNVRDQCPRIAMKEIHALADKKKRGRFRRILFYCTITTFHCKSEEKN